MATSAAQRLTLTALAQPTGPQCVIRTVESAPGTGHRVSSITFEHKPRRSPVEVLSQQQPISLPPPPPLPSLSSSEPAMASESDDSDQSMGSSLSSPPSSSCSPTLAKPTPAMTPIQPALTVLTAGVDGSHSASLVSSTGVELRGMLATLRTRSGKTPVGMRSEGAETQEFRSLKSLLPLNEDVQRTFILLAELARSGMLEAESEGRGEKKGD